MTNHDHVWWHSLSVPPFQPGIWCVCLACGRLEFKSKETQR